MSEHAEKIEDLTGEMSINKLIWDWKRKLVRDSSGTFVAVAGGGRTPSGFLAYPNPILRRE